MDDKNATQSPFAGDQKLLALTCVLGPALVALIPMAAAPALPEMARVFAEGGSGQLLAQLVMTAPAVMIIIFAPITGLIIERVGNRLCMLICLALYVLSGASVLVTETSHLLIASRLLLGLSGGGLLATSLTLIGNCFSGEARERLLGYATAVSSLFAAGALVFGGALVDQWGWRAPFALYLLGLPVLLTAWCSIEAGLSKKEQAPSGQASGHRQLIPTWPLYALLIVLTIGMFTPSIQGPFVLESRAIDNASIRGLIIGMTAIAAFFSAALYGKMRHYLSAPAVLSIDACCMGAGLIILAQAQSPTTMMLGCALVGVGAGLSEPAVASLVLQRTPIYVHGLAMGLIVSALNSGQFLNPLIMGQLHNLAGLDNSLLILGICLGGIGLLIAQHSVRSSTSNRELIHPGE